MPKFLNNNPHVIYVNLPSEAQPVKLKAYEEREATGEDADALDATPGVINLSDAPKDVIEQVKTTLSQRELLAGSSHQEPGARTGSQAAPADDDLSSLSAAELKKRAKAAGHSNYSKLNKKQLVKLLSTPAAEDDGGTVTSDQVPAKGS